METKKYEYETIGVRYRRDGQLQDALNSAGCLGWEVCAVLFSTYDNNKEEHTKEFLVKRPYSDEVERLNDDVN